MGMLKNKQKGKFRTYFLYSPRYFFDMAQTGAFIILRIFKIRRFQPLLATAAATVVTLTLVDEHTTEA
ncbi:hypothetical protein P4H46_00320 [Paenibacillus glucanolyticus]|uniref:hypothetical protein n=1 Tax=Paenibacillus glucanolyticus TaxID=59843 RepID=UPI0030C94FF8